MTMGALCSYGDEWIHRISEPCSVFGLVVFFLPEAEGAEGFVAQQRNNGDGAFSERLVKFLVDEVVGEIDVSGVFSGVTIEDTTDTGSVDGTETHRTRLTRGIDGAASEIEGA